MVADRKKQSHPHHVRAGHCAAILAPIVRRVDGTTCWKNHYPLEKSINFDSTHPMDTNLCNGWCCPSFEQLGPAVRFSKAPKLSGRISGDIILFVSTKRTSLEAPNFAVIVILIPFTTHEKTTFTE